MGPELPISQERTHSTGPANLFTEQRSSRLSKLSSQDGKAEKRVRKSYTDTFLYVMYMGGIITFDTFCPEGRSFEVWIRYLQQVEEAGKS